jgi:HSP20 family protein
MLNNLKRHAFLPAVRRWDSMLDSVMGKLDLFPGEELRPELEDHIHPEIEVTEQAVTVRMAVAGYSKKELTLEIENDMLNVRGERDVDSPQRIKGKKVLRNERSHIEFCQSVRLPGDIKAAGASAVCCDGILTVSIPRENSAMNLTRKIEVK